MKIAIQMIHCERVFEFDEYFLYSVRRLNRYFCFFFSKLRISETLHYKKIFYILLMNILHGALGMEDPINVGKISTHE